MQPPYDPRQSVSRSFIASACHNSFLPFIFPFSYFSLPLYTSNHALIDQDEYRAPLRVLPQGGDNVAGSSAGVS